MSPRRRTECAQPVGTRKVRLHGWNRFSVWLCILLFFLITWVVQRRLSQYEAIVEANVPHLTATKVLLTDRQRLELPSMKSTAGSLLLAVFVFAGGLRTLSPHRKLPFFPDPPFAGARPQTPPGLTYFFFLPPPRPLVAL